MRLHQNATFSVHAKLLDAAGAPLDPTGWKVVSEVRAGVDEPLVARFTVKPAPDGFILSLTAKETAAMKPEMYLYDVLGTAPDGTVSVLAEGDLEVVGTITELP